MVTCLVIYYFQIKLVIPMRNQHQISPYISLVNSHLSLHTQLTFNKRGFYTNPVFSILATSLLIKEITSYGQEANYIYTVFSATVTLNMVQEICKRKTIMLYNLILKPEYETHLIATVA